MNLATALVLTAGGQGSGCRGNKCGRPKTRSAIPPQLRGLAAEARKTKDFAQFYHDFSLEIKHGRYYHVTDNPAFSIDPNKGPHDRSSMSDGDSAAVGKLMVTSDLDLWTEFYGRSRPYVAVVDMSSVPRDQYRQVNRGFGNEFLVEDPSKANVTAVLPVAKAKRRERDFRRVLEKHIYDDKSLRQFYKQATAKDGGK